METRLRAAVESSPSGILMIDRRGLVVLVNREVERLFGYSREELLGQPIENLIPERFRQNHPIFRYDFLADPKVRSMGAGRELFGLRKDGTEVPVEIGLTPVATEEGLFVLSSIVDITARKKAEADRHALEEQLRASQKLEAIGTLAGGIAHDFNNILAAIVGYAELLREEVKSEQARADLADLLSFADRGKQLVQRILLFSRREVRDRRPLALTTPVNDALKLLRATLPTSIEIDVQSEPVTSRVLADPTSVHQLLMNLATNAAHAMPGGGRIAISLEPCYVRDSIARANPDLHEGPYIKLAIQDNGTGIDPAIRNRVFDPFFTTKAPGQGTGLGLAIVHGIMAEHGGTVRLESEVGRGTRVECLFPALEAEPSEVVASEPEAPRGHGERVLLIDDEPAVGRTAQRRIIALGYAVTLDSDPRIALKRFEAAPRDFDIVVTDYTMPAMNGRDLAARIHAISPGTPILLTTGFVDDLPVEDAAAAGIRGLLRKPATMLELANVLHETLKLR